MPHPKASPPPALDTVDVQQAHDLRGVLRIGAFRRLWIALSLSSLGDWLGLLATAALATALGGQGYAAQSFAVAGVFIIRLLPAIVLGPIAGVVADRLDRRWTMVICDICRFGFFLSIPIVGSLWWLYVASFLIECASMMWIPAKEATIPNLVPKERLEAANQLSLLTTYGTAPLAAVLFTLLSLFSGLLGAGIPFFSANPVDLALYFNAATFLFSALTIFRLREITRIRRSAQNWGVGQPGIFRALIDGWAFVGKTPLVRGLIIGMVGAFAAGGAVVGLAPIYVQDLGAGNAAYGVLFGTVFTGLAAGMVIGPRTLRGFSRRRLFGLSICGASISLALVALVQNIVLAVILTFILGAFAGVGWVTGYTLLGLEVTDDVRGRTFAFVQSLVRIVLVLVLAIAPLIAGAMGRHELRLTDDVSLTYNGSAITFLIAGLLGAAVGVASYRQMDDRKGMPLLADLVSALHGDLPSGGRKPETGGFFVAIEGGEGVGKTTQAGLLGEWLREKGHEVVLTREPGATRLGKRLRDVLLSPVTGDLSPRAEALMYAADRAEHVASVIRPALQRGAVVVTDRYADSSVAYQGAGRVLPSDEVARLCKWATDGLLPDLTVVLDVPPKVGLGRVTDELDRLEAEPVEFHERVRAEFLRIAEQSPDRYLVVDAADDPQAVFASVRERLDGLLPLSPRERAELEERRRQEEEAARERAEFEARQAALAAERARLEEQRRRGEEERARIAAEEEARRRAAEEARRKAEEEERLRVEAEERRRAEEEARRLLEEEARRKAEEEARRRAAAIAQRNAEEAERRRIEAAARSKAEDDARRWREQLDDTDELSLADELLGPWQPAPEPVAPPGQRSGRHAGKSPDTAVTEELPRVPAAPPSPQVSPDDETHRLPRVVAEGETREFPPVGREDRGAKTGSDEEPRKQPRAEP